MAPKIPVSGTWVLVAAALTAAVRVTWREGACRTTCGGGVPEIWGQLGAHGDARVLACLCRIVFAVSCFNDHSESLLLHLFCY